MKLSEDLKSCLETERCGSCVYNERKTTLICPGLLKKAYEQMKKYEETALTNVQEKIINMVLEERKRQDAKWGEQNHSAYVWSSIIGEEYGEICQAINEFGFNPTPETEGQIYIEAIQTMASCMAMIECIERNRGKN